MWILFIGAFDFLLIFDRMEIADGLHQAVDVCSFSQSEQSAMTLYHSRHQRLKVSVLTSCFTHFLLWPTLQNAL